MRAFNITNQRLMMKCLLTGSDFDALLVREITIRKGITLHLEADTATEVPVAYAGLRELVFGFIKGTKTPSYMKFVLLSPEEVEGVDSRSLNILYRDEQLVVTSGLARRAFTPDREAEEAWDGQVARFLSRIGARW